MRRARLSVAAPELNLMPMLDMISLLIQVLLINIHFGALAELASKRGVLGPEKPPGPSLDLSVAVDERGVDVTWSAGAERLQRAFPCALPCAGPGDYPSADLRDLLRGLKTANADEKRAVVTPKGSVPFEIVALTLDSVRADADGKPLFPEPVVLESP